MWYNIGVKKLGGHLCLQKEIIEFVILKKLVLQDHLLRKIDTSKQFSHKFSLLYKLIC
jgi:hypothetical protein